MNDSRPTNTQEEVRLLIAYPELCSAVGELFFAEGVAAYGDYRDLPDETLLRDAIADGVEYIVILNTLDLLRSGLRSRNSLQDLQVNVYLQRDQDVRPMAVGAVIKMVQQRRFMA